MSQQNFRKLTALSICIALVACGGGGGGSDTPSSQTGTGSGNDTESTGTGSTPTSNGGTPTSPAGSGGGTGSTPPADSGGSTTPPTGGGSTTPPSSGSGGGTPPSDGTGGNSGSPTTPPASTFTAELVSAPNPVFFDEQAEGTYPNATVRFVVSGTGLRNVELVSANDESIKYGTFTISPDGTRATLDWKYQSFPHLAFDLRILAWDVPAGETGESIEVMPARRYTKRPSPGMCAEYQRQTGEKACGSVAP